MLTDNPMVAFSGVEKILPEKGSSTMLFRINSARIAAGDRVCLFGPSGCGKTTLLRMLARLDRFFSGQIDNQADKVCYVSQEAEAFPWLTVDQHFELCPAGDSLRPDDLLEAVGLEKRRQFKAGALSGGERRRLLLALCMSQKPDLLLLDEPFNGLDYERRGEVADVVLRLQKEHGFTLVFVSHDTADLAELALRVLFFPQHGQAVEERCPAELLAHLMAKKGERK